MSKDSRKSELLGTESLISFCVFLCRPLLGKITTGGEKNCSRGGKKRFPFCFHLKINKRRGKKPSSSWSSSHIYSKRVERKQKAKSIHFLFKSKGEIYTELITLSYQQVHGACMCCDVRLWMWNFIFRPTIFSEFSLTSLLPNFLCLDLPQALLKRRLLLPLFWPLSPYQKAVFSDVNSKTIKHLNATTSSLQWNFLSFSLSSLDSPLHMHQMNVVKHNK